MGRVLALLALVAVMVGCGVGPTPTPTAGPFSRHTAEDAYRAFQAFGLPVSNWQPSPTTATFLGPHTWTGAYAFAVGGNPVAEGGRVYIFAAERDREALRAWLAKFPQLSPYVYAHGDLLVDLPMNLSPEDAARYQGALDTLP
jgi:hypothetical protein